MFSNRKIQPKLHFQNGNDTNILSSLFIILLGLLTFGCSSTTQLSSVWQSNTIKVDGLAGDWNSFQTKINDSPVSLGIRNDDEFVYVCLMSTDEQFRRQAVGLGLTVWFESEHGNRLGLNYPLGLTKQDMPSSIGQEEARPREDWDKLSEESLNEYEILGTDENDRHRFSIIENRGVTVKIGSEDSSVVYEMKVPMKESSNTPYAIESSVGSIIKIEIKSGTFGGMRPGNRMGEGRRGDRMPGGMQPPGGEMPQGRRRGTMGRRPAGNLLQPLDFTTEIRLANSDSK